jgi:hypothetical protein
VSSAKDIAGGKRHKRELTFSCSERVGEMEQKNIRRRVYDALNVLMALNIIRKGGTKEIMWQGEQQTPALPPFSLYARAYV